jgi:hypothetical protein
VQDKSPNPKYAWGATAIGTVIGVDSPKAVYNLLEDGLIDGAVKFGSRWALDIDLHRESVRRRSQEDQQQRREKAEQARLAVKQKREADATRPAAKHKRRKLRPEAEAARGEAS